MSFFVALYFTIYQYLTECQKNVCFCPKSTFTFFESSPNFRKNNQNYDFLVLRIEVICIIL